MSANKSQIGGNHYKKQAIEVWDFVDANKIPYIEGNAIKYIARHQAKDGAKDLLKSLHYVQKALEVRYGLFIKITPVRGNPSKP